MIRSLVIIIILSLLSVNLFSQVTVNPVNIDYSQPKEYEIGGITISGIKYLDQNVLQHISGLVIGEKIMIPGDKITQAIKKLWDQKLFSDIRVTADKIINNSIFLDIYLQELPRLSKFNFTGIRKGEESDLRDKIRLTKGGQVTENVVLNSKNIIRNFLILWRYKNETQTFG